jgi:alcohol dehydrogenase
VVTLLERNGVESVVYDKVEPNPVSEHVEEGASIVREKGCDFVVGLGGGSTLDSAKAIALMAANSGKYWDYMGAGSGGRKTPANRALPIVAITTTAGTGSEANPWAVITKTDTNEKIGFGNDSTFPTLSIVDPELMVSVPPKTTAYTGIDAFCHSVEAYIAKVGQPASDRFALEAVGLITKYLPVAVKDGGNIEARTKLAWANTAAGFCTCLSSCISQHSMEHAISAYYPNVPHGAGLAILCVAYFGWIAERGPDRFGDLAEAMGREVKGLSKEESSQAFIEALKQLIEDIGLGDERLSNYGVKRDDLKRFAENSFDVMGKLYARTPVEMSVDDVVDIYKDAYA